MGVTQPPSPLQAPAHRVGGREVMWWGDDNDDREVTMKREGVIWLQDAFKLLLRHPK
jgi:hypothetical protein